MSQRTWKQLDLETLVHPVAAPLEQFREETIPFVKVHRLIDSYEAALKYAVCISLAAARREVPAEQLAGLEKLLAESIARPSLGHWQGYLRQLILPSSETASPWLNKPPFNVLKVNKKTLNRLMDSLGGLRNHFGHGAVADPETCQSFCDEHDPLLLRFLLLLLPLLEWPLYSSDEHGSLRWCGRSPRSCDSVEGSVADSPFVLFEGQVLSLLPLLYLPDEHYFFNALVGSGDKAKLKYLSYQSGSHREESFLAPRFLADFPQETVSCNEAYLLRQEELDHLVGREDEVAELCVRLSQLDKGHLMVWGAPGVGKGGLMARVMDALDGNFPDGLDESQQQRLQAHANGIRFDWFARQGDADPIRFLREMARTLASGMKRKVKLTSDLVSLQELIQALLQEASAAGHVVTMVVDGLDETLGPQDENLRFLRQLPSRMLPGCFLVMSSRMVVPVRNFWLGCDPKDQYDLTLQGLSAELVRAMLFSQLNKYSFLQRPEVIEAIYKSSIGADEERGNPLYVTLTIKDIQEGKIDIEQPLQLPGGLEERYDKFLRELPPISRKLLYLITASRCSVSRWQLTQVLKSDRDTIDTALEPVLEMLIEDPATPQVEDYSLFHKSLGDYLYRQRRQELQQMSGCWLDYCRQWLRWKNEALKAVECQWPDAGDLLHGTAYAMRHFVDHWHDALSLADEAGEQKLMREAMDLIDNEGFRRGILEYCGSVSSLRELVESVQLWLSRNESNGNSLQAFFSVCTLFDRRSGEL